MTHRLGQWSLHMSSICFAGLLITLPMWRHRVLLHRGPAEVFFEFHDVILYTNDVLWIGALIFWLASRRFARHDRPFQVGPLALFGPLTALLMWALLTSPWALDPQHSFYGAVRLFLTLLLYLFVVNSPFGGTLLMGSVAGAVLLQAGFAIPQFVLRRSIGLKRVGEQIVDSTWAGASVVEAEGERWLRAYGLTQHPNLLGGCMMVFILLLGVYILSRPIVERRWMAIPFGMGLLVLLLSFSRAAWLGTVLGALACVCLLWARGRLRALDRSSLGLIATIAIVVVIGFVIANWPLIFSRLGLEGQGTEIRSVQERDTLLAGAHALILSRPLIGVGYGNFATALYALAPATVAAYPTYQPVHNVLLLATAELGIGGGIIWLAFMAGPWIALAIKWRSLRLSAWLAGVSGALAAMFVVSWFDHYLWSSHQGHLLIGITSGLWAREWLTCQSSA